jgi:hypothetical protein
MSRPPYGCLFQTCGGYDTFKNKSIPKKRVRLRSEVWKETTATFLEPHPDARKGTEYTGVAQSQQESKIFLWIKNPTKPTCTPLTGGK